MVKSNDNKNGYARLYGRDEVSEEGVYEYFSIKPVINLHKCALQDGCSEEKVVDYCLEDGEEPPVVEVDNTFSFSSKIFIIMGAILVISGVVVLYYYNNVYKKKIENVSKK